MLTQATMGAALSDPEAALAELDREDAAGPGGGPMKTVFDFGDMDQADRDAVRGVLERQREKQFTKAQEDGDGE